MLTPTTVVEPIAKLAVHVPAAPTPPPPADGSNRALAVLHPIVYPSVKIPTSPRATSSRSVIRRAPPPPNAANWSWTLFVNNLYCCANWAKLVALRSNGVRGSELSVLGGWAKKPSSRSCCFSWRSSTILYSSLILTELSSLNSVILFFNLIISSS